MTPDSTFDIIEQYYNRGISRGLLGFDAAHRAGLSRTKVSKDGSTDIAVAPAETYGAWTWSTDQWFDAERRGNDHHAAR